jgi:hypothetical protein
MNAEDDTYNTLGVPRPAKLAVGVGSNNPHIYGFGVSV